MPDKDPALEGLIAGALEMVSAIELGALAGSAGLTAGDPAQEEVEAGLAPPAAVQDGYLELTIAPDAMSVEASFHPATGGGAPLTLERFREALRNERVTHGIQWVAVTDALERCNDLGVPQTGVIAARGDSPTEEVPQHFVVEPALVAPPAPPPGEEPVDYRSLSPFHLVSKGQIVANVIAAEPGIMGTNVRGAAVPFRRRRVEAARIGRNLAVEGETVLAKIDGRFLSAPDAISVSEVLTISGDVDYSTGHVDFPGDVVIHGQVKPGFRVKAGGSLLAARVISATEVIVGGDLVARQGILGRGSGVVRVHGSIRTGFIENCFVESRAEIEVGVGCLNSIIHTLDRLTATGSRGVIVGGTVLAQNGVRAGQIGTESGSRTEIRCGVDYEVNRKLEWIRDRSVALALKLKEIERRGIGHAASAKIDVVRTRIRSAIRTLGEKARSLAADLDKNEGAEVVVSGTVYSGTYIEICRVPLIVERPLRSVRIGLSKERGKIFARPLVGPAPF